jgi:DNA-binding NarL/FixJ family response regulator
MRLVVAVHSREVKTALFLALNGLDTVTIVATATSTAELVSYCRAFRPDVVVVERGLPGLPLIKAIPKLDESMREGRVLLIDGDEALDLARSVSYVDVFKDIADLVAALPEPGEEAGGS